MRQHSRTSRPRRQRQTAIRACHYFLCPPVLIANRTHWRKPPHLTIYSSSSWWWMATWLAYELLLPMNSFILSYVTFCSMVCLDALAHACGRFKNTTNWSIHVTHTTHTHTCTRTQLVSSVAEAVGKRYAICLITELMPFSSKHTHISIRMKYKRQMWFTFWRFPSSFRLTSHRSLCKLSISFVPQLFYGVFRRQHIIVCVCCMCVLFTIAHSFRPLDYQIRKQAFGRIHNEWMNNSRCLLLDSSSRQLPVTRYMANAMHTDIIDIDGPFWTIWSERGTSIIYWSSVCLTHDNSSCDQLRVQ